jgi:O-antigen ligase
MKKNNLILILLNFSFLSTVLVQFFLKTEYYSLIRITLYLLFLVTFFLVITYSKINLIKNWFLNFYLITIYLSSILLLIISIYKSELMIGELIIFSLPIFILYIGYTCKIGGDQLSKLVLRYMLLVTVFGLFVIFNYGKGFTITDQYFFSSKNQAGPFIASVIMMSLLLLLERKENYNLFLRRKFLLIVILINIGSLLALRNRSGIIALGFCFLVFLISKISLKKKIKKELLLIPIIILIILPLIFKLNLLNYIFNAISQSMFNNYHVTDLYSVSAGRLDVYIKALEYLKISPLFGELWISSGMSETPHNFLLYLWVQYGVLGMLPITVFYIFLWIYVLVKIIIFKEFDVGLYLILFMLVISIFEYTYPFSPLTTVSLSWFFLGYYLRNKDYYEIGTNCKTKNKCES